MTTGLSNYQIAVLQAMNIVLLQPYDQDKLVNTAQVAAKTNDAPDPPAKIDAQSRVADLRASLLPDDNDGDNAVNTPPDKIPTPLAKTHFDAFCRDISRAFELLNITGRPELFVASEMYVDTSRIVLPASPNNLTSEQKRTLWRAIGDLVD